MLQHLFYDHLDAHSKTFQRLEGLLPELLQAALWMADAIAGGAKILVCGNGGSAADAQHFAAELVGRFQKERRAWPAIALTTDTSAITAIANDYSFDAIFSRQVEALGRENDLLLAISTSGNSANVLSAIGQCPDLRMKSIALLGKDGGKISPIADLAVTVPSNVTAHIQEAHIFILHLWCAMLEQHL
ncbi:MAG: D-sedoheptulose 7-phosphate isomerase [Syntrophobacteraceae bacterium]|nr:D-sedoheptulose 7-phosphate isomerase [Syntrophobacteraceae bacterium]